MFIEVCLLFAVLATLAYWWVKETYSFFLRKGMLYINIMLYMNNKIKKKYNIESVYRKLKKYSYIFVATKVIVCKISILYTQICNT